jgi:hypothetical protein
MHEIHLRVLQNLSKQTTQIIRQSGQYIIESVLSQ